MDRVADGANPFQVIMQIRKSEQEVEVEEDKVVEITLSIPSLESVPAAVGK